MEKIKVSNKKQGDFSIVGHVGVGHVHSHSGFVQDDSAGFAVIASIMKTALNANTTIKRITLSIEDGTIEVETEDGGIGKTFCRRGITPWEAKIMEAVVGEDGIYTQNISIKTFGRMYGQGVTEVPVSLQGAIALAVMDTFYKKSPDKVMITKEKYQSSIDKMAGLVIEVEGKHISLLLNINGSEGGIGPDEDNEGNTIIGEKALIMEALGINKTPTIIVESKAYIPTLSKGLQENTFLFRAEKSIDNVKLAEIMGEVAYKNNYPYKINLDILPQIKNQLSTATKELADKIISLANELKEVDSSREKVSIVANMAKLISEDAGGVTFMSNSLHETVRSAGIVPNNAAVISLLVNESYIEHWKIPMITEEDIKKYIKIIIDTVKNPYWS